MTKSTDEDLEAFLRRQEARDLVAVLLEFAKDQEAVQQRLARTHATGRSPGQTRVGLQEDAVRLAAFHQVPRLPRSGCVRTHARRLAGSVARELLPKDPAAALSLFEAFIEADQTWFERADDSDGVIGNAVRAACRHWLQAAARCEAARDAWPEHLLQLYQADEYGARVELLRCAHLLLDEPEQRGLSRFTFSPLFLPS